ncbi:MAG: TetR/AcrR family transcriptional regulator [Clostridiales bacterium]|nr:TetR/AcrR family transcriptional regulator [Clostridiales bacterium]
MAENRTTEQQKKVQKRTIESREKLLKAAFELFAEKGYYYTNTKEIVKRAGISIGNFYNYFKDKADIYVTLATQYVENSLANVVKLMEDIAPLNKEEAYVFLSEYLHSQLLRVYDTNRFFDEANVLEKENEQLRTMLLEKEEMVVSVLEEHLKKHRKPVKKASYAAMARLLYVTVNDVSIDISRIKDETRREEYIEALANFIINYVYD